MKKLVSIFAMTAILSTASTQQVMATPLQLHFATGAELFQNISFENLQINGHKYSASIDIPLLADGAIQIATIRPWPKERLENISIATGILCSGGLNTRLKLNNKFQLFAYFGGPNKELLSKQHALACFNALTKVLNTTELQISYFLHKNEP